MERTASGSSRALSRHSAPLRGSRVGRHPDRPRRVRSRASSQATQRRLPVVAAPAARSSTNAAKLVMRSHVNRPPTRRTMPLGRGRLPITAVLSTSLAQGYLGRARCQHVSAR